MTESATRVSPLRVLVVGMGLLGVGIVVEAFCAIAIVMLLGGLTSLSDLTGFGTFVGLVSDDRRLYRGRARRDLIHES